MSPRSPAVVIGLDSITGLQTARILSRRGVPVVGIAENLGHYGCRTRVCRRVVHASTSGEELVEALVALGSELDGKAVLFPCTDPAVHAISRQRDELAGAYHVLLPEHDVVELLMDKVRFTRHAQDHELAIPDTYFLTSRAEADAAAAVLGYPCILKPPLRTPAWDEGMRAKVLIARNRTELLEHYDRAAGFADMLLAQQWVGGRDEDLYSCNCYFDRRSEPLVTFVARKLRQWPPEAGTSTLGEECRNDVVLEETIRLFKSVRFHGLGYLEMKRDPASGRHFIIEPNIGRPTGRSAIAEAGGVELLYTAYCDAVGLPLPEAREQRYLNAKWIFFRRDCQSALHYWRKGELTLGDWRRSLSGKKMDAVFSWTDPAPFLLDLLQVARKLVRFPARGHRD